MSAVVLSYDSQPEPDTIEECRGERRSPLPGYRMAKRYRVWLEMLLEEPQKQALEKLIRDWVAGNEPRPPKSDSRVTVYSQEDDSQHRYR